MKELKDIVLKKGDRVYFTDGTIMYVKNYLPNKNKVKYLVVEASIDKITKIERPIKYETIYEAPKQILDKEEKKYLENVIRPFRDKVKHIKKLQIYESLQHIQIIITIFDCVNLPYFKENTMYKGMELDKEYTLEELGLFK